MKVKRLNTQAILPTRSYEEAAAYDLYALESAMLTPHVRVTVKTGIAMQIPKGHVGLVRDRSSMGKQGITVVGGVIDSDYRGELMVMLVNLVHQSVVILPGDKIAQILILPVHTPELEEVVELDASSRGDKGFGSTGK